MSKTPNYEKKALLLILAIILFATAVPTLAKKDNGAKGGKVTEKATPAEKTPQKAVEALRPEPGTYVVFDTTMGEIICVLYEKEAPIGTSNFIGLAEGTREYTDPKTGKKAKSRYYDGLIFHRVIPNFMIQGGDPSGNGTGGPGYEFKNEISEKLRFDRAGRLAYANRGPDTNGSQFFITEGPTPHLNGGYTIFGQVLQGQEIVAAIARVPRDHRDNPNKPVVMEKVSIVRIKEAAKAKK